jgi:hemophore-related protein
VIIARVNVRRGVLAILAAAVLTGVAIAIVVLPSAKGDPDPCTAANLTVTISKVNQGISQYLQAHPDTNQALTDVAKQSPFAAQSAFTNYFKGNTAAAADLHALQQPMVDLSNQCGFQVTPGQVLGALSDL